MRVASLGELVFALTLIGIGIDGLVRGDFSSIWHPVPQSLPARELLAYLCAGIALASGTGLLWPRTKALAARVLLAWLLLWLILFNGRIVLLAPTREVVYQNCGETLVLVAAAWVLYAWSAGDRGRQQLGFATGETGLRVARVLYGLALIAFGLSHFVYLENTARLVPGWLPAHIAWAYFTGGAYLAAGAGVLSGVLARLAAVLSALEIGLFTVLVWIPMAIAGQLTTFQWTEFEVSWALTAGAWVVATSYHRTPWLAFGVHQADQPPGQAAQYPRL